MTAGGLYPGMAFAVVSGVLSGSSMLPMKFLRHWNWENVWLVFSIFALFIFPAGVAVVMIPDLSSVYRDVPIKQLAPTILCGLGWGLAQPLFGLSISRLGLALGYAIVIGFVSVLGTLVPFFLQARTRSNVDNLVLSGVAMMIPGIVALAWAGRLRDQTSPLDANRGAMAYSSALALAIICGLLSPMLNYSFAFSDPIRRSAIAHGITPVLAGYAVWPLSLLSGLAPNVLYSLYLLRKNRSWQRYKYGLRDPWLAVAMGALWTGSLILYGMCAAELGRLGTSAGWGIIQILTLLTAAAWGHLKHEWDKVSRLANAIRYAGISLLFLALLFMASSNTSRP